MRINQKQSLYESFMNNLKESSDDIEKLIRRGNTYIPVRKGETDKEALKRAKDTTKPISTNDGPPKKPFLRSPEMRAKLFDLFANHKDELEKMYDPSKINREEIYNKVKNGIGLNINEYIWYISGPHVGDTVLSGDGAYKLASDGNLVKPDRFEDYEKDPAANQDAIEPEDEGMTPEELEAAHKDVQKTLDDLGVTDEKARQIADDLGLSKEERKMMGLEESTLTETTNRGIEAKKKDLHDRIRQALKDAGDKDWENLVDYTKRLPQEVVEEFDKEEDEIWCIEMIHSILTYTSDRNIDSLIKDRYLQKYIDEFGEEKVRELLAGEIEEYKNATIHQNVHTDSEGVSYNSVTFKDDINESNLTESEKVIWTSDSTEQYDGWSDEDFINEYRNQTGEEPESVEQAQEWFINDDDIAVWDIMVEDLESMIPSIQEQTTDNIIFMCGTVGRWTGNHGGGKVIEVNDAKDLLFGDDIDVIRLVDDNGNIEWEGIHHDGTHHMWLYAMPKDEETRKKLVEELGIVDWYKDMYSYDDENGPLEDALNDLYSASRLNDILVPKDYATISQICQPIKNNIN